MTFVPSRGAAHDDGHPCISWRVPGRSPRDCCPPFCGVCLFSRPSAHPFRGSSLIVALSGSGRAAGAGPATSSLVTSPVPGATVWPLRWWDAPGQGAEPGHALVLVIGPDFGGGSACLVSRSRPYCPLAARPNTPSAPRAPVWRGGSVKGSFCFFAGRAYRSFSGKIPDRPQKRYRCLAGPLQVEVCVMATRSARSCPDSFETFALAQLEVPEGLFAAGAEHRRDHGPAYPPDRLRTGSCLCALDRHRRHRKRDSWSRSMRWTLGHCRFLAALSAQAARGDPVVIRRPDPSAPLDDAAPFIAQVVAALGGTLPSIESAAYWSGVRRIAGSGAHHGSRAGHRPRYAAVRAWRRRCHRPAGRAWPRIRRG